MKTEFRIGERVQIRSWEDMAHNWYIEDGVITMFPGPAFVANMKHLCGRKGRIKSITLNIEESESLLFDFFDLDTRISENSGSYGRKWLISEFMLSRVMPIENDL